MTLIPASSILLWITSLIATNPDVNLYHTWYSLSSFQILIATFPLPSPKAVYLHLTIYTLTWSSIWSFLAAQKPSCISGYIKWSMTSRLGEAILSHYCTLLRPHLESCVQLWGPQNKRGMDQSKKNIPHQLWKKVWIPTLWKTYPYEFRFVQELLAIVMDLQ